MHNKKCKRKKIQKKMSPPIPLHSPPTRAPSVAPPSVFQDVSYALLAPSGRPQPLLLPTPPPHGYSLHTTNKNKSLNKKNTHSSMTVPLFPLKPSGSSLSLDSSISLSLSDLFFHWYFAFFLPPPSHPILVPSPFPPPPRTKCQEYETHKKQQTKYTHSQTHTHTHTRTPPPSPCLHEQLPANGPHPPHPPAPPPPAHIERRCSHSHSCRSRLHVPTGKTRAQPYKRSRTKNLSLFFLILMPPTLFSIYVLTGFVCRCNKKHTHTHTHTHTHRSHSPHPHF